MTDKVISVGEQLYHPNVRTALNIGSVKENLQQRSQQLDLEIFCI